MGKISSFLMCNKWTIFNMPFSFAFRWNQMFLWIFRIVWATFASLTLGSTSGREGSMAVLTEWHQEGTNRRESEGGGSGVTWGYREGIRRPQWLTIPNWLRVYPAVTPVGFIPLKNTHTLLHICFKFEAISWFLLINLMTEGFVT